MKKPIFYFALCALHLALCFPAPAQHPKTIPRIGYLAGFGNAKNPGAPIEAFQQGLRDLGYVAGKNITVEWRYIEFIINLKAAKQIGLTIPPNVLARAGRVIKESAGIKPAWSSG